MSAYAWQITRTSDLTSNRLLTAGPVGASNDLVAVAATKGDRFRMGDDDRNIMYWGRIAGDYTGFEPLDDLGTPDAGCTYIEYFQPGKGWTLL